MYTTSYKLNNSYTTYVIHDYECASNNDYYVHYHKPTKCLEWKPGTKVKHTFHGIGVINSISQNQVLVHFKNSKAFKKFKNIQVAFEFKQAPKEIDSLSLCY